jgi:hypothetical protein
MFVLLLAFVIGIWIPVAQRPLQTNPTPTQSLAVPTTASSAAADNKQQNPQTCNEDTQEENWLKWFLDWCTRNDKAAVAISTIAVAIFTFTLFVATALLWWSGVQQSKRELRAYVSVTPLSVSNFFGGLPVEIMCLIRNHGLTPAFNTITQFDIGVFPQDLEEPPHAPTRATPGEAAIFPGAEINNNVIHLHTLTQQEINDVQAGTRRLYIWGVITYRLAFMHFRRKRTRFFASAGGPLFRQSMLNPGNRNFTFPWSYGHRHNHAT